MKLELVPTTISDAQEFVLRHHRHHGPAHSYLFALAAALEGNVVAVAICGRPVARMLDDGWTVELVRLASDGTHSACSFLYGRAWRAARALGWQRMVTYTLGTESGSSLRAAGWKLIGTTKGGTWSRRDRPRVDKHPLQEKLRWEVTT